MTDWRHLILQANDLSIRITECMPALIGYHAIFECSAYATTRQTFSDLFPSHVSTVSQFLNQKERKIYSSMAANKADRMVSEPA